MFVLVILLIIFIIVVIVTFFVILFYFLFKVIMALAAFIEFKNLMLEIPNMSKNISEIINSTIIM